MRSYVVTASFVSALMLTGCWLTSTPDDAHYEAPAQGAMPATPPTKATASTIEDWDGKADLNASRTWDFESVENAAVTTTAASSGTSNTTESGT